MQYIKITTKFHHKEMSLTIQFVHSITVKLVLMILKILFKERNRQKKQIKINLKDLLALLIERIKNLKPLLREKFREMKT